MPNGVDGCAFWVWVASDDVICQITTGGRPGVGNRPDRIISKVIEDRRILASQRDRPRPNIAKAILVDLPVVRRPKHRDGRIRARSVNIVSGHQYTRRAG